MKTGIELIAQERAEQIRKHSRTTEWDIEANSRKELSLVALQLLAKEHSEQTNTDDFPENWDEEVCQKMLEKPYMERLIIAGALIAAEIDRLRNQ